MLTFRRKWSVSSCAPWRWNAPNVLLPPKTCAQRSKRRASQAGMNQARPSPCPPPGAFRLRQPAVQEPAALPVATEVPRADVQITLWSSSTTPEYIVLQNQGTGPQDMSDWYLESTVGPQTFNFPMGFVLA